MKRASIDIGSNTVLLLAAEINADGTISKELANESRVTSLGKDLDKTGVFREQSMDDTYEAFQDYENILGKLNIPMDSAIVTATEASRVAKNAPKFLEKLQKEFGVSINLINGEGEAFYTSYGVVKGAKLTTDQVTIMDIGGASTELINVRVEPFQILDTVSLPMGAVRCSDWLKNGELDQRVEKIFKTYDLKPFQTKHLLCVAGSMTSLAGMIKGLKRFNPMEINNSEITFKRFLEFSSKIKKKAPLELLSKFPFLGKRAESIVGGAYLGEFIGNQLQVETFEISTLGLRYGTIMSGGIDGRFRQSI
ncbi:MAG: hypothetical protein NXH75_06880 [Halobacteriovoraceae bacterium]|nr:hypothetical protein [Halobacteriovoraceae bacterium]